MSSVSEGGIVKVWVLRNTYIYKYLQYASMESLLFFVKCGIFFNQHDIFGIVPMYA